MGVRKCFACVFGSFRYNFLRVPRSARSSWLERSQAPPTYPTDAESQEGANYRSGQLEHRKVIMLRKIDLVGVQSFIQCFKPRITSTWVSPRGAARIPQDGRRPRLTCPIRNVAGCGDNLAHGLRCRFTGSTGPSVFRPSSPGRLLWQQRRTTAGFSLGDMTDTFGWSSGRAASRTAFAGNVSL